MFPATQIYHFLARELSCRRTLIRQKPTKLPMTRNHRRPSKSEFGPNHMKDMVIAIVHAGTYQMYPFGSPKLVES